VDVAVSKGAKVVSMSFGGADFSSETSLDYHFNVQGVSFVASAGDSGSGVNYPAASPYIVAVGGTTAYGDSNANYQSETAWSGSGGGISAYEAEPTWQSNVGIASNGKRAVPDVAYDADPNTGFSVYDSFSYNGQTGWFNVGGTSAGSPQWAGLLAIANSMRVAQGKATLNLSGANLYSAASSAYSWNYHDVTSGTNGTCGAICTATSGYDYVTGGGSPVANNLINTLAAQQ
jgi:subtilase family serine protease